MLSRRQTTEWLWNGIGGVLWDRVLLYNYYAIHCPGSKPGAIGYGGGGYGVLVSPELWYLLLTVFLMALIQAIGGVVGFDKLKMISMVDGMDD